MLPTGAIILSILSRPIFRKAITSRKHAYIILTKTCLYNLDPLKPVIYIVKLGFTGVYIIFLILLENIDCGYSLEPPRRGGRNEYHNLCSELKYEKYQSFLSENFQFLEVKFSIYLNRRVFVMVIQRKMFHLYKTVETTECDKTL